MALPEFEESGHERWKVGGREQHSTQQDPEGPPLAKATAQAGSQLGLWLLLPCSALESPVNSKESF